MAAAMRSTTIKCDRDRAQGRGPTQRESAGTENRPGTACIDPARRRIGEIASRASTLLSRSHDEVQILFNGVCCAASSKCCQQATAQGGIRFLGNEVRDVSRTSLVDAHLDQRRLRAQTWYLYHPTCCQVRLRQLPRAGHELVTACSLDRSGDRCCRLTLANVARR